MAKTPPKTQKRKTSRKATVLTAQNQKDHQAFRQRDLCQASPGNIQEPLELENCKGDSQNLNSFAERKQKLMDETQEYMYQQSSKFSSVSRFLIVGIIGTIWILTYAEGKLLVPNYFLLASLISSLLFLFIDVIHYFADSMSYQKELYRLDDYKSQDDLLMKHELIMNTINKRSHRYIIIKYCVLMLAAVLFIIGLSLKISFS